MDAPFAAGCHHLIHGLVVNDGIGVVHFGQVAVALAVLVIEQPVRSVTGRLVHIQPEPVHAGIKDVLIEALPPLGGSRVEKVQHA